MEKRNRFGRLTLEEQQLISLKVVAAITLIL